MWKNVVFGNNGLFEFLSPGKIIIDMSSINPDVSRKGWTINCEKGCGNLLMHQSVEENQKAVDGTLSVLCAEGKREVYITEFCQY